MGASFSHKLVADAGPYLAQPAHCTKDRSAARIPTTESRSAMRLSSLCAALAAAILPLAAANAQQQVTKSTASGFFIGLGLEGDGLTTNQGGATTESGSGGGLELGYGFNKRWSLYGELSGAQMNASGGDTYSLAHLDLGARVHFRAGPNVVVPFLQFGLAGRAVAADVNGSTVSGSGGGLSLGGGLNAHFTPSVAFSGAVTWTVGTFDTFRVDNQTVAGSSIDATTARVHLGIIWFPH